MDAATVFRARPGEKRAPSRREAPFRRPLAGALLACLACLALPVRASTPAAAPPIEAHRTAWTHLPAEDFVLYLPQRYDACLGCHPKELAEEEDFNVDTNWRDTTLGKNLHSLHVYRQPTGVNCAVCHVLSKDGALSYGERVNLKATGKGGSCTPACHRPKSYGNAGRLRFPAGTPSR